MWFASSVLFLFPVLALTTRFGLTLIQLLMLVTCLWLSSRDKFGFYRKNFSVLTWILAGFIGFFVVSLGRMLLAGAPFSMLDGPSRVLFGLSCIGFVGMLNPRPRYFWLGLCIGAIAAGLLAMSEQFHFDGLGGVSLLRIRAEGFTHHAITFGDLSLAMGLMALCALGEFRGSRLALLPVVAVMFGLIASILSGSRGGWMALVFAIFALLRYGRDVHGQVLVRAIFIIVVALVIACLVPQTGVSGRMLEALSDIRLYFSAGNVTTSVGVRLELWKASWLMFLQHPFIGVGRDQFFDSLQLLYQQGQVTLVPNPVINSSSHNDILYFLATGGLLDFSFFVLIYGAPLIFFLRRLRNPLCPRRSEALAGLLLVLCFFDFGLTDTMFWLMMPKIFYSMMVCTLIGFCLSSTAVATSQPQSPR